MNNETPSKVNSEYYYKQGENAYKNAVERGSNPYPSFSSAWYDWDFGWNDAEFDATH